MSFDIGSTLTAFWENYGVLIIVLGRRILVSGLIIIGGRILIRFFHRLTNRALRGKLKGDETFSSLLKMIINYGVVIVCFIMILDVFGVNTTGLIALLGAAGVTIGFALKDTLSNIAAGIILIVLRPFHAGDFIECGSLSGSVRELRLFTTIMETGDGIFISVPNSNFWGVPLKNFSRNEKRRMDITVSISYSDSIDRAFQVLNGIILEENRFLDEPAPQVMVQSLGESGIAITLRAWVPINVYGSVYSQQLKNVKEKIEEAGLRIALPKLEVYMGEKNRREGSTMEANSRLKQSKT